MNARQAVFFRNKRPAQSNRKCEASDVAQILEQRQQTAEELAQWYRQVLPPLLHKLAKIPDPRQPTKITHKITTLLLYGILLFAFQMQSRRQANRELSDVVLRENLSVILPELESLPHADTLARLLERITPQEIEEQSIKWLRDLIRRKKFRNYLIRKRYLIAIDGTQKLVRDYALDERCQHRKVGENGTLYSVYVLECLLIFDGGMVLPLMTEFLENKNGAEMDKQDCERRAFYRVAARIKQYFPKLPVTIVADGLYACEPVLRTCQQNNWQYMITLKEGSMPAVYQEAQALMALEPTQQQQVQWGDRTQSYTWANDIEYGYGQYERHKMLLHVVICHEAWYQEHPRTGQADERIKVRYAWLSSQRITPANVFDLCTHVARYRWQIENNILTEKHRGYAMEHNFSDNWQAMTGFHLLMNLAQCLNQLMQHSEMFQPAIKRHTIQGFFRWLVHVLDAVPYDKDRIRQARSCNRQWRLCPVI
jgi:hypothetical protein